MSALLSRRSMLQVSGLVLGAQVLRQSAAAVNTSSSSPDLVHLNLNENAYGPSPQVGPAIQRQIANAARYADAALAQGFAEQIAAHERVPVEQVILGEVLGALGLYLGSAGGPGGEFIYSTPGYLALVDAASHVGGVGVGVPLNAKHENDLPALLGSIREKTRALYLINPHNPTGTVSTDADFKSFLRQASQHAPVIVDEAYLEYTSDFATRSAVSLTRDGANVLVFRTFDKIHGLAGLPIGYTIAPKQIANTLRAQGLGDAEGLGRLNIVAAQAALEDTNHVASVRSRVAEQRERWNAFLRGANLVHTNSEANFIFFDGGKPHAEIAESLKRQGVLVGRAFSPYDTWQRITIGLPDENQKARRALKIALGRA